MNCKTRSILLGLTALLIALLVIAGCGDDGGGAVVTNRPSITQTSPWDGAVDTNLNPLVRVWFDQALEATTVDSAAFHVEGAESHRVEYVDSLKVINLYLREILEPESTYTAVVTTGIKNTNGHGMLSDFSFSFTTGTLDQDHLIDYMEPNDDMDSAMELDLNKTYTVLGSCGDGDGEGDWDYYRFSLTEPAKVTLRIDHSYSELDRTGWLMRFRICGGSFYNSLLVPLDTGESINLRYSFLPGTYCVETGNTEGSTRLAVYDLTLETSTPCPDDEYEDNDFMWEAAEIGTGIYDLYSCNDDTDYFKVYPGAGHSVTATVSQVPPGNIQRRLRITDPGNNLLRESTGTGDPMTISWPLTGEEYHDSYHIVIFWWEKTEYTLQVDFTGPTGK
jgi:hypothetical protein